MFYSTRSVDAARDERRAVPASDSRPFLDPVHLAGSAWRARGWLVGAALLGAVAAGAVSLTVPKQYAATAQLVIDPRDLNLVQNEVTVTPGGLTNDATLALIESQIAVMTSHGVLSRVVDEAVLTADPEFNGTRKLLLSSVTGLFSLLSPADPEEAIRNREQVTIENLARRLTAVRSSNSFVINLTVRSEDAAKAARLANLATETFIAEQGRAQGEVARRATAALSSRLAELRTRVTSSEDAVERYKSENGLVGVAGRLIDDDYLTRVNTDLANARAQVTTLNVRAQSLREASVDDVVEGSYPEGLNAESLLRLRQTYSEAAQNAAVVAARLGPRHPTRIAAEEGVSTARRAIQTELARIVASAQTELARARQTEADLSAQIDTLRSRQLETSGAFVRLRELEREVDASRAVYEAFLLRARQTSEQESLNTANVRVISDAIAPLQPSGLSRKIVAILGALGGLALALGVVLLRALFTSPDHGAASVAARRAFAPSLRAPVADPVRTEPMPEPVTPRAAQAIEESPVLPPEPVQTPIPTLASWDIRETQADQEPLAPVSEPDPVEDIQERRNSLRERIREIGARRTTLDAPELLPRTVDPAVTGIDEPEPEPASTHLHPDDDAGAALRERVSLRLEAVRRRRLRSAGMEVD